MPLDPVDSNAVIGPYRDVVNSFRAQGTATPEVGVMAWAVSEMERQAALHDDVGPFVADITSDGLFFQFNQAYAQLQAALLDAAPPEVFVLPGPYIPLDDELENRLIVRLRAALERLASRPDFDHLSGPIQEVITMTQRGAGYPVMLRELVERGLDLASQGIVHSRAALVTDLERAHARNDGPAAGLAHALLAAHDELASQSPLGSADPLAFHLRRIRLEWEHAPAMTTQYAFVPRVIRVVLLVIDWLDAHCSFAATDPRFASPDGDEATQRRLEFVRECYPAFLARREQLLMLTWGMSFDDAVAHQAVSADRDEVPWSAARLELARQARPFCDVGGAPPPTLIQAAEELHARESEPAPGTVPSG